MNVLKLVEYRCRETVSLLKVLLALAMQGKLRGLIVCYRNEDGTEETAFTGAYKAHPTKALGTIMQASMSMMRASGERD